MSYIVEWFEKSEASEPKYSCHIRESANPADGAQGNSSRVCPHEREGVNGVIGPISSSVNSWRICFLRSLDFIFLRVRMATVEGTLMNASAKRCRRERGQQHTAVQSAAAPAIHLHIPVFLVVMLFVSHSSLLHMSSPLGLRGDFAVFADPGIDACKGCKCVALFGRPPGLSDIRCFESLWHRFVTVVGRELGVSAVGFFLELRYCNDLCLTGVFAWSIPGTPSVWKRCPIVISFL